MEQRNFSYWHLFMLIMQEVLAALLIAATAFAVVRLFILLFGL